MTYPSPDPVRHVLGEAMAYVYAAAVRAAVELEVADRLADGPLRPAELAAATGADESSLARLLRLLATRGVFREDPDGRFHLTPAADALRADAPRSIRVGVLTVTSEVFWTSSRDLAVAVRTGEPAFDRRYGRPFFDFLAQNPDEGANFNDGMANLSAIETDEIVGSYDLPATGTVVDVGGGQGGLLLAALRARPGLHGVLFDRTEVLPGNVLGQLGEEDRWDLVAGDFFESVPAGDLYLLKNVLHDWSDEQCVRILENCRRAMRPGGRVLAVDAVIAPDNEPHFGKTTDMFMMLLVPGRERGRGEFEDLFHRAGLRVTRVLPTPGAVSLVEGAAP
jgi:SAM-dependent methyltransferase